MKPLTALLALLITAVLPAAADAAAGPSAPQLQQEQLARLNAARWDPPGWGAANGIDLTGVAPLPPLAVNPNLTRSALTKADEISVHGFDPTHRSTVPPYLWPNELAIQSGYELAAALGVEANTIEAYYAGADQPVLAFLQSANGPHRPLLLEWTDRREVGIGRSEEGRHWIFHLAYRDAAGPFITGTVFDDADGDGRMDAGEGLPGVTVSTGALQTVTNDGGGYALAVPSGTHVVEASGPGIRGIRRTKVSVGEFNVSIDFPSRNSPIVWDYRLCKGRPPTILGTGGDDVIYGTDGPDVIHALGGDDVVHGLKGNDVVCGGTGHDVVFGNGGRDLLIGGSGDDELFGNLGKDRLRGGRGTDLLDGGKNLDSCRSGDDLIACEFD